MAVETLADDVGNSISADPASGFFFTAGGVAVGCIEACCFAGSAAAGFADVKVVGAVVGWAGGAGVGMGGGGAFAAVFGAEAICGGGGGVADCFVFMGTVRVVFLARFEDD